MGNETPKFTIHGNTIEEICKGVAELVLKTQTVEIVAANKGGGQYGLWELTDPNSGEKGLTLTKREFETKAGIPMALGMSVVFRKLTAADQYDKAQTMRKAATINRLDRLKAQVAALEAQTK